MGAASHIWRSTNYGATWSDLGVIASGYVYTIVYCGNGIALLGDDANHVWRSTDYGANWTDLDVQTTSVIYTMAYCGNGIALLGDNANHVYRSTDYGATWSDLGAIASDGIRSIAYCGNGIALLGDELNHVYRSDCAFKTDESASESAISQATPASAGAAGHKGEIRWDAGNLYVCVADNTWKKVAIATW